MGRSYLIRRVVELRTVNGWSWGRWTGPATPKRLEQYVERYAKSLHAGGVNSHLGRHLGILPYPLEARIVDQQTGQVLASWRAAAFQVW